MKKYLKINNANNINATHLRIETYYTKGGYNYYNYRNEERGYYINIVPVEKNGIMESFIAFSGCKKLLKAVNRQSKKAEAEAEKLAEIESKNLVKYMVDKYNLILGE